MSTTFPALTEVEGKLKAKQDELGKIFAEAGETIDLSKVKSVEGDSKAVADYIKALNDEMTDLGTERDSLMEVKRAAERAAVIADGGESGDGADVEPEPKGLKSLGQQFAKSVAYKSKGQSAALRVDDLKTLFARTAGWTPETTRTGRVVEYATRPIQVLDLIPTTTTGQAAVKYMEETTFTNAAAEKAEGDTYGEAALALTERTSVVQKIPVWLPVTDEQLEDESEAAGYIDRRLPFMIQQRLDSQVLVGNGTDPNLRGILNVVGIQTQAKGADPTPDAVYKAMTKVRVTGRALPSAAIFHPNDWQDVRLLRTVDGIYIWGSPSEAGPERIWGLNVAQSDAITENTGLVGDFANFCELAIRRGVEVQVTNAHADFFINGKQAVRADMRAAFVTYRPAAFATVTGI